ncbi:MAG: GTP-binding protein [Acidimicrobiaceae bacterium]
MTVIATAGHVDHGKSSLILALTGTDPDRWAEEKRRGMTIDLGFAYTQLPSGETASFIDVPGHIRFLRNMLAGVGAIVAAFWSSMPKRVGCLKPKSTFRFLNFSVCGMG